MTSRTIAPGKSPGASLPGLPSTPGRGFMQNRQKPLGQMEVPERRFGPSSFLLHPTLAKVAGRHSYLPETVNLIPGC